MKKPVIFLSLATLFAASFMLQAETDRFAKWDKNNDGKVSVEEFTSRGKNKEKASKRFNRLDIDKDGFLNEKEAAAMPVRKAKKKD